MKYEISEGDYGLEILMTPETPEEVSLCARYALNANSEKPDVYMSFKRDPQLSIYLAKKKPSVQVMSIKPAKR